MSARFEVVRTDAGWHARFRAANGRVMWSTEVYARKSGAYNAIYVLAASDVAAPDQVRELDERPEPLPEPTIEAPFYLGEFTEWTGEGRSKRAERVPFWHDREYHSRHCYGDECREETPPTGTRVRGRVGWALSP